MRTATVILMPGRAEVLHEETGKDAVRLAFRDMPTLTRHLIRLAGTDWNIKSTFRQQ